MKRRRTSAVFLAACLTLASLLSVVAFNPGLTRFALVLLRRAGPHAVPAPTGASPVAILQVDLPPLSGSPVGTPSIPVELWFPAMSRDPADRREDGAGTCGSSTLAHRPHGPLSGCAVLLYAPGSRGSRMDNTVTAANLASHGYVVVAMDDIDRRSGDGGGRAPATVDFDLSSPTAFRAMLAEKDAKVRQEARRASDIIDRLAAYAGPPEGPWPAKLDLDRVGFFGWSFGGAVAWEASILDGRVAASANLDGWLFGDAAKGGMRKPSLTMLSDYPAPDPAALDSADWTARNEAYLDMVDLREKIRIGMGADGFFLRMPGTRHESYSDAIFAKAYWRAWMHADPYATQEAVNRYLVAFFDRYLRGDRAAILDGARISPADTAYFNRSEGWVERVAAPPEKPQAGAD